MELSRMLLLFVWLCVAAAPLCLGKQQDIVANVVNMKMGTRNPFNNASVLTQVWVGNCADHKVNVARSFNQECKHWKKVKLVSVNPTTGETKSYVLNSFVKKTLFKSSVGLATTCNTVLGTHYCLPSATEGNLHDKIMTPNGVSFKNHSKMYSVHEVKSDTATTLYFEQTDDADHIAKTCINTAAASKGTKYNVSDSSTFALKLEKEVLSCLETNMQTHVKNASELLEVVDNIGGFINDDVGEDTTNNDGPDSTKTCFVFVSNSFLTSVKPCMNSLAKASNGFDGFAVKTDSSKHVKPSELNSHMTRHKIYVYSVLSGLGVTVFVILILSTVAYTISRRRKIKYRGSVFYEAKSSAVAFPVILPDKIERAIGGRWLSSSQGFCLDAKTVGKLKTCIYSGDKSGVAYFMCKDILTANQPLWQRVTGKNTFDWSTLNRLKYKDAHQYYADVCPGPIDKTRDESLILLNEELTESEIDRLNKNYPIDSFVFCCKLSAIEQFLCVVFYLLVETAKTKIILSNATSFKSQIQDLLVQINKSLQYSMKHPNKTWEHHLVQLINAIGEDIRYTSGGTWTRELQTNKLIVNS